MEPIGLVGRVQLQQELSQTKARMQKLEALHNIGTAITSALELEEMLSRIVEAAVFITGAEEGSLLLLDEETKELHLRAQKGLGDRHAQGFRIRTADSIAGEVVEAGRPQRWTSQQKVLKVVTGYMVSSILYVPVAIKKKVIGVLVVDNQTSERAFGEEDEHLLMVLAGYAAIALENARLREELDRQAHVLAATHGVSRGEAVGELGPSTAGILLHHEPEPSPPQALTPEYLATVVTPYLSAIADIQQILDEIEGRPASGLNVVAITEGSPLPVGVEGAAEALRIMQEIVVPWKQDHAEVLAQLVEKEQEAAMEGAWAEVLRARARATLDEAEWKKLLTGIETQHAEAVQKGSEGRRLRLDFRRAQLYLALDIVVQIAPGLSEDQRLAYAVRLLPALEAIIASPLQLSASQ